MVKFGDRVDQRTLTINERVLLHIYERSSSRGALEAPFPLTQQGIARALRMRVNHVSRAVKALESQNCVTEESARVRGEVRKRKVYLISHGGHAIAQGLVAELGRRLVLIRGERGVVREMTMSEARKLPGGPFAFTDVLSNLDGDGVSDVTRIAPGGAETPVSHVDEGRPRGEPFFGRDRDLAALANWTESPVPAILILGPRGAGKTALASKVLDGLEDQRHTLWFTSREGDPPDAFVRTLAAFLTSVGRGDLSAKLLEQPVKAHDVRAFLERDWPAPTAVLVLDDAHRLPPDVLRSALAGVRTRGGKAILTAEGPIPDQAELRASGVVQILTLGGLDKSDARRLAPTGMSADEFEKVYRLSGGNPLRLRLLATDAIEGLDAKFSAEERALLRILKLRQESD